MISTTIEQSKHLLELGLDPASADMEYCYIDEFNSGLQVKGDINAEVDRRLDMMFGVTHIPAWSLSALLEVMPKEIKKDDKQYNFHLETTHNLYYVSYYRYDIDGIRYLHTTEMNNCTIDAAYEMVCWLLEQGLIEKGGQDGRD